MAFVLLIPSIAGLVYMNQRDLRHTQETLATRALQAGYEADWLIRDWLRPHIFAVQKLTESAEQLGLVPSEQLQQATAETHAFFPDFHVMLVGSDNATTLAFDPPINARGESTIGINYADREWFQRLKATKQTVISDVFLGRGGVFVPIITISSPIVDNGKLSGFGLGTVDLGRLQTFIATLAEKSGLSFTVIDRNGLVVVSSAPERKPLEKFVVYATSNATEIINGVFLHIPELGKNIPIVKKWQEAQLFTITPVELTSWKILTEAPLAPLQNQLYQSSITNLSVIYLILLVAGGASLLISQRLSRPLNRLSRVSADIPEKIETESAIDWPVADSQEMQNLVVNFRETSDVLREKLHDLKKHSDNLENLVAERTEELQANEKKLAEILQTAPIAISWADQFGNIEFINKKFTETFGYFLGEIPTLETWFSKAYPDEEYRKEVVSNWEQGVQKAHANNTHLEPLEATIRCKDGELRNVFIFGSFEQDRTLVFLNDITEWKKNEELRLNLEDRLRQAQKMEAVGTLAGGIAHDFNNMLAIIQGNIQMAQRKLPPDSKAVINMQRMAGATDRATELVRQILAFSRQQKPELIPLELSPVINETMQMLRSTLPRSVELKSMLNSQDVPLVIRANATQIQQILINLCTNAVDAMDEEGQLAILLEKVSLEKHDFPPDCNLSPGDYARLTVLDTGPGIAAGDLDKIFDPFFTTKEAGSGTGMGLSVVHGVVKDHGGFITVDSQPGVGTSFLLYFPVLNQPAEQQLDEDEDLPVGNEQILLVDDEQDLLDASEEFLTMLGYRVTTCASGTEALELFSKDPQQFDLVITDQTMPKLQGTQLASQLLALRQDMPIILCTGYSGKINEEEARNAGIKAFCQKPLKQSHLANVVREVLDAEQLP